MLNLKAIELAYTVTNWYTVYQKNSVDVKKNLTSDNKGGFHLFIIMCNQRFYRTSIVSNKFFIKKNKLLFLHSDVKDDNSMITVLQLLKL